MWTDLLTEPKTVLGPYAGQPPDLTSFAPHSWRADFNHVAVAGQFLQCPQKPPERWLSDGKCRAYCVFEFLEVRMLRCVGTPIRASDDDSMHLVPVGKPANCKLDELDEVCFENHRPGIALKWKRFSLNQLGFNLELEASFVMLYVGRQAIRQYGWPER